MIIIPPPPMSKNYVQMNKKNVNFGHIYAETIDRVRKLNDGYFKTYEYDAWDDYCDNPMVQEGYLCKKGQNEINLMSDEEVLALGKLVERASKLNKSIISPLRPLYYVGMLVVDKDGNRDFDSTIQLKSDNTKHNLDELEILVKKAEEYENNPEAVVIEPFVSPERFLRANKERPEPRYNDMYAKAIYNVGHKRY